MDEVYRLSHVKLLSVCQSIARDRSIAEDVLQDVYVTVWRVAARFDPRRGTAMTWLIAIARNRSLDRYRAMARFQHVPPEALDLIADPRPSIETSLIAAQMEALAEASLRVVEPRGRILIQDGFLGGLTYAELARREGVSLSTVKSIIRRSLAKARLSVQDLKCV